MSDADEGRTVTVTSKGQATIPKEFREKLHIETPGRVRFIEREDGEIVIRPVERPSELRGALAGDNERARDESSATAVLRAERERDKEHEPEDASDQSE